jgi:hypothetical protein
MSNSTHRVNVVRIDELHPHPSADTLSIVYIGGYQCVVKTDNYKVGDLALYIQPDTIVPVLAPFNFLWADRDWDFPSEILKYRRVTVRRFRKEWSEGLLMPLEDFFAAVDTVNGIYYESTIPTTGVLRLQEGDDVAELLGFTHYEEPDQSYVLGTQGRKLTVWQRILKFFGFVPKPFGPKDGPGVYDVESVKNYPRALVEGEQVIATEKIHGSNARYYFDGETFWVGSHKKWWKDKTNIWWRVAIANPWIEEFCRQYPLHTLRGEVTPTQTGYQYGNTPEEQFFAFDVQKPNGEYVDKVDLYRYPLIYKLVPVAYQGPYNAALLATKAEGRTLVGMKNPHLREGLVISTERERVMRGLGRAQLKLKSMAFLEKESK